MDANKTKVRYGVKYRDMNYEYALHSFKKHFLRNIAEVINVIEYCVTQELKKNDFKVDTKMYEVEVTRFVNDKEDENWMTEEFKFATRQMIEQMISDTIQRTK